MPKHVILQLQNVRILGIPSYLKVSVVTLSTREPEVSLFSIRRSAILTGFTMTLHPPRSHMWSAFGWKWKQFLSQCQWVGNAHSYLRNRPWVVRLGAGGIPRSRVSRYSLYMWHFIDLVNKAVAHKPNRSAYQLALWVISSSVRIFQSSGDPWLQGFDVLLRRGSCMLQ